MGCPLDVIVLDNSCVTEMSFRSFACSGEMNMANKPISQRSVIVLFLSEVVISRKMGLRLPRPSARRPSGCGRETALHYWRIWGRTVTR
jgi:hypothetical protein